jgi:hypothetical protein
MELLAWVNIEQGSSSSERQHHDEEIKGSCHGASIISGDIFGDNIEKRELIH